MISVEGIGELGDCGGHRCDNPNEFMVVYLQTSDDSCHLVHVEVLCLRIRSGSFSGASSTGSWCASVPGSLCLEVGCDSFVFLQDKSWWGRSEIGGSKEWLGWSADASVLVSGVCSIRGTVLVVLLGSGTESDVTDWLP